MSVDTPLAPSRPRQYQIRGQTVTMPCLVRDACSATATFVVNARAASALLPGSELEIAQVAPGRGLLSLSCIDYRDNDLGDYNELSIALFVRRQGKPEAFRRVRNVADMARGLLPTYIVHLPVTQPFTCDAGRSIWGFPKTVDEIELDTSGDRAMCVWNKDGQNVLKVSMPIAGSRALPQRSLATYSYIDGVLHRTPFTSSAETFGVRLGGVQIALGAHPIADALRSLGLPKPALMTMWMDGMRGQFEPAQPC